MLQSHLEDDSMSISSESYQEDALSQSDCSDMSCLFSDSSPLLQSPSNVNPLPATVTVIEAFVNDFMAVTNNPDPVHLCSISQAMLHGIHSIFPPPSRHGPYRGDSILEKKIAKGKGQWSHTKEILRWDVNGIDYTISLPIEKEAKVLAQIRQILPQKVVLLKEFQKLAGSLQHIFFIMPGGWGFPPPIHHAMQGDIKIVLKDWCTIIRQVSAIPNHVLQLINGLPDFLGYCDLCHIGVGGVLFGITKKLASLCGDLSVPRTSKRHSSLSTIPMAQSL